jgi:adenylosuccinate synthase
MPTLVVVGAQWGDEGKGKIVHYLSERADLIVRYQGGNNAGHTVVHDKKLLAFHLLPSGLLFPGKKGVIGHGVVVDPESLREEVEFIERQGIKVGGRLKISLGAHIVFPYHLRLDALQESGRSGIGTTKRGIGPTYVDKAGRVGIRLAEYLDSDFPHWLDRALERRQPELKELGVPLSKLRHAAMESRKKHLKFMRSMAADTVAMIHNAIEKKQRILFEGAQGTMLDIDFGTYPFVTSSHPTAGGACVGAGVGPKDIDDVLGVTKAYTTRVGSGPFPTEMEMALAERLREKGREYGATTGRPRRIGWLDLVQLRYAIRVGGIRSLAMTKLDTLAGVHPLKVCVAYKHKGRTLTDFPVSVQWQAEVTPVYEELPGFDGDLGDIRQFSKLPKACQDYVRYVEKKVGVPISIASVGQSREATILRDNRLFR